ncbi:SMI1/KNR4 family protein [Streptomyces sp. NPDC059913]|uniref:SMI1/KNR4 family protein n=1 Tax=unclassified Streptomyces TaxID=2593676 RepID=UPI00365AC499
MNDDIQHAQAIEERQVADAWLRIETWLRQHAPATMELFHPGATEDEIAALQQTLGVRIPAGLKNLWLRHAGVRTIPGQGNNFMLGPWALMAFDSVVSVYQQQMLFQERDGDDTYLFWRPAWIPVCSFYAADHTSGLYLDAETGRLGSWSRFAGHRTEFESLTDYLEEMADALEMPSLATGDKPGLVNGVLVWGPPQDPDLKALWTPFTG